MLSLLLVDTGTVQEFSITTDENLHLASRLSPFPVCHWVNNKMYCFTVVQVDWFITGDNKTNLILLSCHGL